MQVIGRNRDRRRSINCDLQRSGRPARRCACSCPYKWAYTGNRHRAR